MFLLGTEWQRELLGRCLWAAKDCIPGHYHSCDIQLLTYSVPMYRCWYVLFRSIRSVIQLFYSGTHDTSLKSCTKFLDRRNLRWRLTYAYTLLILSNRSESNQTEPRNSDSDRKRLKPWQYCLPGSSHRDPLSMINDNHPHSSAIATLWISSSDYMNLYEMRVNCHRFTCEYVWHTRIRNISDFGLRGIHHILSY